MAKKKVIVRKGGISGSELVLYGGSVAAPLVMTDAGGRTLAGMIKWSMEHNDWAKQKKNFISTGKAAAKGVIFSIIGSVVVKKVIGITGPVGPIKK